MTGEGEDWRQSYQAEDEFIRGEQTRGGEFVLSLVVKTYIVIVLCSTTHFNTTIFASNSVFTQVFKSDSLIASLTEIFESSPGRYGFPSDCKLRLSLRDLWSLDNERTWP